MEILGFIGMLVTLSVVVYLVYIMSKPHNGINKME